MQISLSHKRWREFTNKILNKKTISRYASARIVNDRRHCLWEVMVIIEIDTFYEKTRIRIVYKNEFIA